MFRGRMGEPFGLQDAIANGIEGNLRSRLAPQGGRRAEQIATTHEVYGLYSEARTLIASRERDGFRRAEALLWARNRLGGQEVPHCALEDELSHPVTHLRVRRQRNCKLNELVVEKRHACFDRASHRHLVDSHQEQLGEPNL